MDCFQTCIGDLWEKSDAHKAWLNEGGTSRQVTEPFEETPTTVESLTLMRSPCLGSCPSYSVTLKADGSVSWEGYCCVSHRGKRTGTISVWQFRRLAALVADMDFFRLENGYAVTYTDVSAAFVSVKQGDRAKTVMDYGSAGPARLWALEQLIDATVEGVKWKK